MSRPADDEQEHRLTCFERKEQPAHGLERDEAGVDHPPDRTFVRDPPDTLDQRSERDGGTPKITGHQLEREQHQHGEIIEEVVADRHREGPSELFPASHVPKGHDGGRNGGPDIGPHDHGHGVGQGSGFSGAATSATTIDVVTDELCMTVVVSNPTNQPMNGFSVALKSCREDRSPVVRSLHLTLLCR